VAVNLRSPPLAGPMAVPGGPNFSNQRDKAESGDLGPIHEINDRALELLAQSARLGSPGAFPLVVQLRDLFIGLTPEVRARASRRAFLLVDMEFANTGWWQTVAIRRGRSPPPPTRRGSFPRASAIKLARSTLMLAWYRVRAGEHAACLLGMTPAVSELIAGLSLSGIDQIVERRFRHIRPRWEDRPVVWRELVESAQTADIRRAREFDARGLRLIAGELL